MISLADFVNVPSVGWLDGVETSSQPAGRGSCGDTNKNCAVRPPGFLMSVSRVKGAETRTPRPEQAGRPLWRDSGVERRGGPYALHDRGAENMMAAVTNAGDSPDQAAAWYSWIRPPRTSRRRTSRVAPDRGGGVPGGAGARRSNPRWGRFSL